MANKVSYLIQLQDRFSRQAAKIRNAVARMGNGMDKLDGKLKKAGDRLIKLGNQAKKAGRKLASVGKSISTNVSAPAAAFTANAIRLFNTQEQALSKVRTGIMSTAGAAKLSLEELTKAATELQNKTLFGDEEILAGATSTLLTFTNIAGEQFKKTQVAVLDLSARMGTDLQSAAVQLGKALNDPVANLSALSRSGIQFNETQKTMIKGLVKSGRLTDAQNIILKELNTQFGGTAEAMAKVGAGPLKQLSNSFGDLNEEIGKAQFEALKPLIEMLKSATQWMANLSPATKKFVGIAILLLTTLGPIVFILGQAVIAFGALTFVAGTLGVSMSAMLLPILGIATAIGLAITAGVLIMRNWEGIKGGAILLWQDVSQVFVDMVEVVAEFGRFILTAINWEGISGGAQILLQDVTGFFSDMGSAVVEFGQLIIDKAMGPINAVKDRISNLGASISSFFSFGDSEIKATQSVTSRTQTDVNVNLRAPERTIESVKSRTSGKAPGLNLGVNMEPAL